jgi:hypothetical protein
LLESGHSKETLTDYTKDQLVMFYRKAIKLEARRRSNFIHDVRSAVWAEGDDLKAIIKILSDAENS